MENKKIVILTPTSAELEPFLTYRGASRPDIEIAVSGIGLYKTAFHTLRLIELYRPQTVILAGIAGAYPGSGLETGESVLVSAETCADLGSFATGGFSPRFAERYVCPYIPENSRFGTAESYSVNAAAAPYVAGTTRDGTYRGTVPAAQIENMEGAAFFFACLRTEVRFLELRTVSNLVGEEHSRWNIPLATARLGGDLKELIDEIEA